MLLICLRLRAARDPRRLPSRGHARADLRARRSTAPSAPAWTTC